MGKKWDSVAALHEINELAFRNQKIRRVHPVGKIVITIFFLIGLLSLSKYQLSGMIQMSIYPILLFSVYQLSFRKAWRQLRFVLPVVIFLGIFNIMFDQTKVLTIGNVIVTGGMLSGGTIILKGCLSVFASYVLIVTTTMEEICYGLKSMGIPSVFVTQLLLMYRYIFVLTEEVYFLKESYLLRRTKEKGIHINVYISMIGQLLLRTLQRAQEVYESMRLRGYDGTTQFHKKELWKKRDTIYIIGMTFFILLIRLL